MTLSSEANIVKINSKALDHSELKRLDKLEKEAIAGHAVVSKGKASVAICLEAAEVHHFKLLTELAYLARSVAASVAVLTKKKKVRLVNNHITAGLVEAGSLL